MASNQLQHLDKNLQECYGYDLNWDLLPSRLREVCKLFAKGLKQRDTSIFLGFIVLTAFCMGHACVNVQQAFWQEPVITWIALVISTGRCKSAFHEFLGHILELVQDRVNLKGEKARQIILPHCTWDKFGELLAENGGRSLGLFDELLSFFSTMNMYSSHKMQISDTREYQDFLQLFTGKSKTRETVTGNANFNMARTSFSFFGMTQPYAAMPVIQDQSNNAKGFTSRILWYFPEPVFAKFEDTILTTDELDMVEEFKEELVNFLADLYIHGESTFQIEEQAKKKTVTVNRTEYQLTENAINEFKAVHDKWELDVCEKNPHDALIGGTYSRGKSHLLRLAVPIQLLLTEFLTPDETLDGSSVQNSEHTTVSTMQHENEEDGTSDEVEQEGQQQDAGEPDHKEPTATTNLPKITAQAIQISHSLVDTCLSQLCTLNDKSHVLNNTARPSTEDVDATPTVPEGMCKLYTSILTSPGAIVSFSLLTKTGLFRRHEVDKMTNKRLMMRVLDEIAVLDFGKVEDYTIPANSSKVYFFCKRQPPHEEQELMQFARQLAKIGMSLQKYITAFHMEDSESVRHHEDYNNRRNGITGPDTPTKKRQRTD